MWSQPNTLQRLSQKSFYNSRVLERNQLRVPLCEEDVRAFIVMRSCLLSLQPKSFPCRTSLFLAGQVFSLQDKSSPYRASLQESETWWTSLGLRFVRDSTQRMGSTFFWPMDMNPLGSPGLISYFILFSCPLHPIWSVAFVQTVNWGDGQNSHDGSMFMRATDRHT